MANTNTKANVKGTANNVGQEIQVQKPSTEVVTTPALTEAEHKEHMNKMLGLYITANTSDVALKVEILTAYEKKEYVQDGYEDTEDGYYSWAEDNFNIKKTQAKQLKRVIPIFGIKDDKGFWSVDDKYKIYGLEKLDRIQSHPKFKVANFDTFTKALGITDKTTVAELKTIVAEAKGKKIEEKPEEKAEEKAEKKAEDTPIASITLEDIKASSPYKEMESRRDVLMEFVTKQFTEAKKVETSHDNKLAMAYVVKYIEEFSAMEKDYNAITK